MIVIIIIILGVRRDSFITHRAFCDALAQESARQPTPNNMSTIGSSLLYAANTNTGLALSQLGPPPQLSSIQDHTNLQSSGSSGGGGGFDHHHHHHHHHQLLSPSTIGSSFRTLQQQPAGSTALFLPDQSNHNHHFHEDHHHQQNKQFHGLMQFAELQPSATTNSIINQPPPSGSGSGSGSNIFGLQLPFNNSSMLISNPFSCNENTAAGGNDVVGMGTGSNVFMGENMSGSGVPSLFTASLHNNNTNTNHASSSSSASASASNSALGGHMSATALLQKAAQMGSSTSTTNNNSNSSSSRTMGAGPSRLSGNIGGIFGEGESSHLQGLMNSFAAAAAGGGGGLNSFVGFDGGRGTVGGSSDRLTRDFLGVGQIVRTFSGGAAGFSSQRRSTQLDDNMAPLDPETAPSGQPFGGGGGGADFQ